LKTKCPDL